MSAAVCRHSDPETSREAAARVSTAELELIVRRTLGVHLAGLTTREIHEITKVDHVSISPRMKPLEKKGFVLRTTEKRNGSTVWRPIFVDVGECPHSDELLVYKAEWPDFFDKPSLHTCAHCGTSVMRAEPVRGGSRLFIRTNDVQAVA